MKLFVTLSKTQPMKSKQTGQRREAKEEERRCVRYGSTLLWLRARAQLGSRAHCVLSWSTDELWDVWLDELPWLAVGGLGALIGSTSLTPKGLFGSSRVGRVALTATVRERQSWSCLRRPGHH